MGSKERREREKQELRGRILDAAREMFVSEGFEAVTMRSLAKRIEYSPTAIYLHFKDKEALIGELCRTDLETLDATVKAIAERHPPIERLYAAARAYVRFALEHPTQYRLLFMMPKPKALTSEAGSSVDVIDPDQRSYDNLRANFVELIEGGFLRPELRDADLLAQTYFCGMHGIVATAICMGDQPMHDWCDPVAQVEFLVDSFLHGIRKTDTKATSSR